MCLVIVVSRVVRGAPLIVAANRDEWLARPAVPMTLLRKGPPRVLGGRDGVAGGTWLSINRHGVFAALTNCPALEDPTRRSRGELPLVVTSHESAEAGVADLVRRVRAEEFNPCWLLAGDRDRLFYVELSGEGVLSPVELGPGVFVLENKALGAESAKTASVGAAAERALASDSEALVPALWDVLRSHACPDGALPFEAACVHFEHLFGTRSSAIALFGADPTEVPALQYTDGPPCQARVQDAGPLWTESRETTSNGEGHVRF